MSEAPRHEDFLDRLADHDRRLAALERSPQLTQASIRDGALVILDANLVEVLRLGKLASGLFGLQAKHPSGRTIEITADSRGVLKFSAGDPAETAPAQLFFVLDDPTFGDYLNISGARYGGDIARIVLQPENSGGSTARAILWLLANAGEVIAQATGAFTLRTSLVYRNVTRQGWSNVGDGVQVSSSHTFVDPYPAFTNSPNAVCGLNGSTHDDVHVVANAVTKTGLTLVGRNRAGATAAFTLLAVPMAL